MEDHQENEPNIQEANLTESTENKLPDAQIFINKYEELIKQTGYHWIIKPIWKLRDDNTFSMVLEMSVEKNQ